MARPVLMARGIAVRYGPRQVLSVENLDLHAGECLAIVGPNGAGKSTLLRVLGLLERPAEGRLTFQGEAVHAGSRDLLSLRRRMTSVFHDPLLLSRTVSANVALGLRLRGEKRPDAKVQPWLDRFGIAGLAHRQARDLSDGEARRTSLARAFVLAPELLLLDEPFASLDEPTRQSLVEDLRGSLAATRTTAVIVTHDRWEALALGDRLGVMIGGGFRQVGRPEAVFTCPHDEETARFLGADTVLKGRVRSAGEGIVTVDTAAGAIEAVGSAVPGESAVLCLRPEDVVLMKDGRTAASSARNRLQGTVVRIVELGNVVRVRLDAGAPITADITVPSYRELSLNPGDRVVASFKATAVKWLGREGSGVSRR